MNQSRTHLGFTFVEILAAMAFLGILIPVVISALTVSNRAAVVAERSTVAVQLGENRLSELMLEDAWTTAESRGDFGQEWPGYRWELKRQDWQSGAMTELTLDVFFVVQGQEHDVRLSTLTNESLKQS
jgi:type II secretory pathway pseudopilin PulG